MVFKCSECNGEIKVIDGKLICEKCNRTKVLKNSDKINVKEIDMNDHTKDMEILYS